MAELMKPAAADDYGAGLWKSDLATWLLWHVGLTPRENDTNHDYYPTRRRQQAYITPSWSWASVTGPIFIFGDPELFDTDGQVQFLIHKGEAI
jgi:hypothetical protein